MVPWTPDAATGRKPSALGVGGAYTRKSDAALRWRIENELHKPDIRAEVYRVYETLGGAQATAKHAKITRNVLRMVAGRLVSVYERPPTRQIVGKKRATAWRETVLGEGKFDLQAGEWARAAFIYNVIHVIPKVLGETRATKRLTYEAILPHSSDVVFAAGERDPSILVYLSDGDGFCRVAVDNERFVYMDPDWKIVDEFRHGYLLNGQPMQPWTPWRVRTRLDSEDYWQRGEGRQLVEATLSVGVIAARMAYTRKNNSSKLTTLTAENLKTDVPPGQKMSPERPLMLKQAEFQVHNLVVEVGPFQDEIDSETEDIAEAYSVHSGVIDRSKSVDSWADHTAVARVRDKMIPHVLASDIETSIKTAVILRADGHSAGAVLDPVKVAKSISVKFQALSFQANPKDRWDSYTKEGSLGLADLVTWRMREHPEEDETTATANSWKVLKRRAEFQGFMAERNITADAGQDGENLAQRQGRVGGSATPNLDRDDEREQRQQQ